MIQKEPFFVCRDAGLKGLFYKDINQLVRNLLLPTIPAADNMVIYHPHQR